MRLSVAGMATWTNDELHNISAAEELELASLGRDGTLSNAVTIWVVRVGDDLYVRSWKGDGGAWFRATQGRHEGHIKAAGVGKDVSFVPEADAAINDQTDGEYRQKYRSTGHATSIPWWPPRRARRRSSWCRASTPLAAGGNALRPAWGDGRWYPRSATDGRSW